MSEKTGFTLICDACGSDHDVVITLRRVHEKENTALICFKCLRCKEQWIVKRKEDVELSL